MSSGEDEPDLELPVLSTEKLPVVLRRTDVPSPVSLVDDNGHSAICKSPPSFSGD